MAGTPEARLDRLERIVRLFVKAGLRYRRDMHRLDRVNILVDVQMGIQEDLTGFIRRTDTALTQIGESQSATSQRLEEVIAVLHERGLC